VDLLIGPPSGESLRSLLYLGEADDVRDRVDSHLKGKDFWTTVIAFTSKDDNLNKAHVRYLEVRLLGLATAADRVALTNGTAPALTRLSEADRADMEGYLDEMLVILPLLGVVAFEAIGPPAAEGLELRLISRDAQATGADTPDGFVVAQGSLARLEPASSMHTYLGTLRDNLVKEGVLVHDGGRLRFTKSYLFDSPSTAAGVVLGRSANGRIEWKDAAGQTLKAIQEQALTTP
jgi:hypothetical protein